MVGHCGFGTIGCGCIGGFFRETGVSNSFSFLTGIINFSAKDNIADLGKQGKVGAAPEFGAGVAQGLNCLERAQPLCLRG